MFGAQRREPPRMEIVAVRELREQLRSTEQEGASVLIENGRVSFGQGKHSHAVEALTDYASRKGQGDKYTVGAVVFLVQNATLGFREYVDECKNKGIPRVQLIDKEDLLGFVRFQQDTAPGLVDEDQKHAKWKADQAIHPDAPDESSDRAIGQEEQRAARINSDAALGNLNEVAGKKRTHAELSGGVTAAHKKDTAFPAAAPKFSIPEKYTKCFEMEGRTRDNIADAPGRSFVTLQKRLQQHTANMKRAMSDAKRSGAASGHGTSSAKTNGASTSAATTTFDPRGDRYAVAEDRYLRETLGHDVTALGIDTGAGFRGIKKTMNVPGADRPPAAGGAPAPLPAAYDSGSTGNASGTRRHHTDGARRPILGNPIIMLPGSREKCAIRMANAQAFLGGNPSQYIPAQGDHRMPPFQVQRYSAKLGRSIVFDVADRLGGRLNKANVVALVCAGNPRVFEMVAEDPTEKPADVLTKMQGIFFALEGEAMPANLKGLPLHTLCLSRTKRHEDITVYTQFWDLVDEYLQTHILLER
ncbi:Cell division cycle protein 73 [Porphyridium purpureum]|uniref:Cell division cycle protein 73 n=1 Tax=Porphyridium purpureum TaxID=35688 RepID=A0A5J4YQ25_PORPP|nr:Cell division cycle protein 73 [Porphyridium purpureum]|eukprot:POR3777..scf236_6